MILKTIIKDSLLPSNETELLLAFILQIRRETINTHLEQKIDLIKYLKFKRLEKKRLRAWPIAYLIEQAGFYKLDFIIDKRVLIPRPETELLLEQALEIAKQSQENKTIIDIGTGSGAIIISLAKELKENDLSVFNNIQFIASDISRSALKVAKKNIDKHQLQNDIEISHSNLLKNIESSNFAKRHIIITANLPYLTPKQIQASASIKREPRLALDGGVNGLKYYKQLFWQINQLKYKKLTCLCEIDFKQKEGLEFIVKKQFSDSSLEFLKDLGDRFRLAIIKIKY